MTDLLNRLIRLDVSFSEDNSSYSSLCTNWKAFDERRQISLLKKKVQKTPKVPIKGGTKIEGRGGRKNVLKRTKTNAPTAQTNVLLNAKYLNFPIRCKN